ncbi:unnamed protein product [Cylindrotheca closterium]|uniref:Uncharacterized protein n=1 Tax=Cylindrotheca closterium TaxID=2856 RepID=A0AAD2CSZ6_9STRA|nr:unnamed protein product [Cylindrotheca closterium]
MIDLHALKGEMIQIFAGKYAGHEAWMDNSQTWHVNKGTDTAPVIVRLRKGKGLVQSTIWKSSFQGFDPNASPHNYTKAVLCQRPGIKKNLVCVTRQMAQCIGARQKQGKMVKVMAEHLEDAFKLQESCGADAICRNIQYPDPNEKEISSMISGMEQEVKAAIEERGAILNAMETNSNKRSASGKTGNNEKIWMDNSQTWHVNKGTDTAPVIVRLRKGKGLVQSTIWKSAFQGFDPNASPHNYTKAVLCQRPGIKKNLVCVTRQMAQCIGARQKQGKMVKVMAEHLEDAFKLQESCGADAICRNIQYPG